MQKAITDLTNEELSQVIINTTVQRGILENQLQQLIAELLRRQQPAPTPPTGEPIKLPKLKRLSIPVASPSPAPGEAK